MKTRISARASIFGALILGGCAASSLQGPQVTGRPTTSAFEHHGPPDAALATRPSKRSREDSPLAQACKSGRSKACTELGDGLVLKHAHAEARHWYVIACDRARNSMVEAARQLIRLDQELKQAGSARNKDEYSTAAGQRRTAALKSDASELRARIRGCLDSGETLKVDGEPKQSLTYFDAVCEFSVLVDAASEALPDLEHMTKTACAASKAARAELPGQTPFSPRLFADLLQPARQPTAARHGTPKPEAGMTFSGDEL